MTNIAAAVAVVAAVAALVIPFAVILYHVCASLRSMHGRISELESRDE